MNEPDTEPFSARYAMVRGAEVVTWNDDEAVMDFKMFNALAEKFGDPFVGYVGGRHYEFKPERQVPSLTVAVPQADHNDPSALLIQK